LKSAVRPHTLGFSGVRFTEYNMLAYYKEDYVGTY
jgi:hypothetical protein